MRRTVRVAVVGVGLLLTAGAGYRAFDDEVRIGHLAEDAAEVEVVANQATEGLLDIRASLHAYVAPGQGLPFWAKRAQSGIDALRQNLTTLDAALATFGGSLAVSLDGVRQLAAAEQRARTYASRNEFQIAGDVIFTEVRDLLATTTGQAQAARSDLSREYDRRTASIRREQFMLGAAAVGWWILIAMILLRPEPKSAVQDPGEWRHELAETLNKIPPAAEPVKVVPPPTPAPMATGVATSTVKELSGICAELSALSDPAALDSALARVTAVLDATGLIVWTASADGATLSPVAVCGFDPKLVARIGMIPRESSNLTAAAFRDNQPKTSAASDTTAGALAIAMCGPSGPAGVLSVELKPGQNVGEGHLALAAIVAAQLATLALPATAPQSASEELKRAAI